MKQLQAGEEKRVKKTRYKPRTKLEQDVREIKTWLIIIFLLVLGNFCFWFFYPIYTELTKISTFFVLLGDFLSQ